MQTRPKLLVHSQLATENGDLCHACPGIIGATFALALGHVRFSSLQLHRQPPLPCRTPPMDAPFPLAPPLPVRELQEIAVALGGRGHPGPSRVRITITQKSSTSGKARMTDSGYRTVSASAPRSQAVSAVRAASAKRPKSTRTCGKHFEGRGRRLAHRPPIVAARYGD